MKILSAVLSLIINSIVFGQTYGEGVTDINGNEYASVIIGNQEWMASNLIVSHYNDGTTIPNVASLWSSTDTPAWCWYDDDSAAYSHLGKLYNGYAVSVNNPKNICPVGWIVPSKSQWDELDSYLRDVYSTEIALAIKDTVGWQNGSNGTNELGFSAIPGGERTQNGYFYIYDKTYFYTSDEHETTSQNGIAKAVWGSSSRISSSSSGKGYAYSVRCMKDTSLVFGEDTTNYYLPYENFQTRVYLDSVVKMSRADGLGDSLVSFYSKFEFGENVYSDTVLVSVEDTLNIQLDIATDIEIITDELLVWSDGLSIFFESTNQESYAFELISSAGIKVMEIEDTENENHVSLTGISVGIYLAKFTSNTDGSVIVSKIFVLN